MLKKSYEWTIDYETEQIKVRSWYDFTEEPMKGGGEVTVDHQVVGSWALIMPDPNKPFISLTQVSDRIRFLNIYAAGAFKPKISVEVNGKFIYQDRLNFIDRYLVKRPKIYQKIRDWSGLE